MKQSTLVPTVSIILPVYNAATYLRESIDSVLRQDYTEFELIIVNDGSSDDSQAIIDQYAARDKRIVSITQKNMGLVKTLNRAISLARGELIARIDGDDPWFDGKLSAQTAALRDDPSLVLIGGGFEIINEEGYYLETVLTPTRDEDIRRALMLRNAFGHAGVVFRKKAAIEVGLYDSNYTVTEDYALWIKLASIGRVKNLPYPVYRYRINMSGLSQQNSDRQTHETRHQQDALWNSSLPRLLTRREIRTQATRYFFSSGNQGFGVALKYQFLEDNAQLGVRLIARGRIIRGIRQILAVATIGRSGARAAWRRMNIYKLRRG